MKQKPLDKRSKGKKKPHIVIINNRFYPAIGGSEWVALTRARSLSENFKVTVLTTCFQYSYGYKRFKCGTHNLGSIKILRFPAVRFFKDPFTFSPKLLAWIIKNRHRIDALYTFSYGYFTSWAPALLKKLKILNIPIIFQPHYSSIRSMPQILVNLFHRTLGDLTIKQADIVTPLTPAYLDFFKVHNAKRIVIIPPSIKPIPKMSLTRAYKLLEKFSLPKRKLIILSIGRLEKYKGVQFLIKSLPLIRKLNPEIFNKIHITIAGTGSYEKYLRQLARILDLPNVKFVGKVKEEEKVALFNIAKIFVLLSYSGESFGLVLAEAASRGLAILGSNLGAIPFIIKDKQNGLLVNPFDYESIAQKIILLSKNYKKYRQRNLQLSKTYSLRVEKHKITQLFKKLLTENPKGKPKEP